jgi:2-deoxystreptamine N-acetyl-D-glucosaminyltransferase / 2-deoxystreptamine glucosyltransferase
MRVLRLTPFFHHDCVENWPADFDAVGGMQIQILRLSRALAERGVCQRVLTAGFPGLPRVREDRAGLTVSITRAPLPRIPSELTGIVGLNQAWLAAALVECIRLRQVWRPDLIQAHADGQLYALLAGPIAARLLSVPYCVVLHCSRLAVYQPMSHFDRWQHGVIRAAEEWALRNAAGVCTLTGRTAEVVAGRLGCARDQIDVVPDVVELHAAAADSAAVRAFRDRVGLNGRAKVVGLVGRIAHEKGWLDFVRIAAEVANDYVDTVFLIVGDGPQRERMAALADQYRLTDRIIQTGFLPSQEIPAVMAALDVLVMPSKHEELGGSAIEAMLAGTPVACYAVGGLQDTVGRVTPDLAVPAGEVDELARVVRGLLKDSTAARAKIDASRVWLEREFDIDRGADAMLRHYDRALAAIGGRRSRGER